jgi:hypothetical protein
MSSPICQPHVYDISLKESLDVFNNIKPEKKKQGRQLRARVDFEVLLC